ncbi:MAG: cytidylate kinase-like family protein [Clostridia bacterium]|nr:cytidylate kinase-like family protein [Clostridia bacterium]
MKIITISREFGSGGRELGKRLADALGIPCYDHQIIDLVAEKENLDKAYVANRSEKDIRAFYPTTIARGFSRPNYALQQTIQIMASEQEIIRKLAGESDCVIVGRAADIILSEYKPFRIFVCADELSKLSRCYSRAETDEKMTDKEILRKCREIDRHRASYRSMFTDKKWGLASGYDLCVNTTEKEIKSLIPALTAYINAWYSEEKTK